MKVIKNESGVYYISDDSEENSEIDPESMLENSVEKEDGANVDQGSDVVTINSEKYIGIIQNFTIKENRISGKRIIKLVISV